MTKATILVAILGVFIAILIFAKSYVPKNNPKGRILEKEQLIDMSAIVPQKVSPSYSEATGETAIISRIAVPYYWEGIDEEENEKGVYDVIGRGEAPPLSSIFSDNFKQFTWSLWSSVFSRRVGENLKGQSAEIPLVDGATRCSETSCIGENCEIFFINEVYLIRCDSLETDPDYASVDSTQIVSTECEVASNGKKFQAYCLFQDFLPDLHIRKLLSDSRCSTSNPPQYCDFDNLMNKIYCGNGACRYLYPELDQESLFILFN